jgi:hypothetical protein
MESGRFFFFYRRDGGVSSCPRNTRSTFSCTSACTRTQHKPCEQNRHTHTHSLKYTYMTRRSEREQVRATH